MAQILQATFKLAGASRVAYFDLGMESAVAIAFIIRYHATQAGLKCEIFLTDDAGEAPMQPARVSNICDTITRFREELLEPAIA